MAIINERKANNNFVEDGGLFRLPNPQEAVKVAYSTALSATPQYIKLNKDHKSIILLKVATAGKVKFSKGTSMAGIMDYETETLAQGEHFLALESAKFVNKETGEIAVTGTGSITLAVLEVR